MNEPLFQLLAQQLTLPMGTRLCIGLSGGMDSVVLLHLLAQLSPQRGWSLSALHVHHGISPNADQWSHFCLDLCQQLNIPLDIQHVDISASREKLGIEAAARLLRRKALFASNCDVIALAQHQDDQVETLLLQLLRGTGVRGSAAMASDSQQNNKCFIRPLLNIQRKQLLAYAEQKQLNWIDDESNQDISYARNFLRHQVLPVIEQRFPAYRNTLSRASEHFREASQLLDELAASDAKDCINGNSLHLNCLPTLNEARVKNLLRFFIAKTGADAPQSAQLDEISSQIRSNRMDSNICINFGQWQIRRFQGKAYLMLQLPKLEPQYDQSWCGEAFFWPPLQREFALNRQFSQGKSLSWHKIGSNPLSLRLRTGGETLQIAANRPRRSLKNLYQELNIPPWLRDRLPILYCGNDIVAVWNVGVNLAYQATSEQDCLLWADIGPAS